MALNHYYFLKSYWLVMHISASSYYLLAYFVLTHSAIVLAHMLLSSLPLTQWML